MKRTILVRGARQLLTLRGPTGPRRGDAMRDLGVIEDGSVLIVNGVVESVGPTRRIENLSDARSAEEINASGHVVLPGFVDSHTHLIAAPPKAIDYRLSRNSRRTAPPVAETISAGMNWVRNTAPATLEFQARRHIETALRHGTTTMEIKTGYGLNAAGEAKMLRVLAALGSKCVDVVPTYMGAHAVPPEYTSAAEYVAWLCTDQLPRVGSRRLAEFADVFCDPSAFTVEHARAYLETARRAGLGLKLHGEQSAAAGTVRLAVELDAVSIDGLNEVDEDGVGLLARSRTIGTLLPGHVYQGAYSRLPPARDLVDAGAAVAIASGFNATVSSTISMQMVISLACSHMGLTPEEAIAAATINGAHAVARSSRCGSLEYGKDADLLMLNVSDYRDIPYHFGGNQVALAMRKGEVVYREGAITCIGA